MNRRTFLSLPFLSLLPKLDTPYQRIGVFADTQNSDLVPKALEFLNQQDLKFCIIGGDLSDVVRKNYDQAWQLTLAQFENFRHVWYAVGGNHDLCVLGPEGKDAGEFGPLNVEAVNKFKQYTKNAGHKGELQFAVDSNYTRFIGINWLNWPPSLEYLSWLNEQLNTNKRKVVIQHVPWGAEFNSAWYGPFYQEKLDFFLNWDVDLLLNGHRHHGLIGIVQNSLKRAMCITCPSIDRVAYPEHPDIWTPDKLLPTSLPFRGWLVLLDKPDSLYCEVYRAIDGIKIWEFRVDPYQTFFPMIIRP